MYTTPGQATADLRSPKDFEGTKESFTVTPVAELGVKQVDTITFGTFAATAQGDFVVISNKAGTKFAVWLDKDNNATAPAGPIYTAANTKIEVDISTGDTAAQVRNKVYTAISASITNVAVTEGAGGLLTLSQTKMGVAAVPVPKNSAEAAAGSITTAVVTAGVASNLLNKYFTFGAHFVWFNVNSEGSDPAPGGTAIASAHAIGATAATILAAMIAAINLEGTYGAVSETVDGVDVLRVRKVAVGGITDASAGNSGLSVSKLYDGYSDSTMFRGPGDVVDGSYH